MYFEEFIEKVEKKFAHPIWFQNTNVSFEHHFFRERSVFVALVNSKIEPRIVLVQDFVYGLKTPLNSETTSDDLLLIDDENYLTFISEEIGVTDKQYNLMEMMHHSLQSLADGLHYRINKLEDQLSDLENALKFCRSFQMPIL